MKKTSMINLLKNQDIIVFGEDFSRHPHSLEHLLKPLFHQNRFIWVETVGLRSPRFNFYDFKKMGQKILRWLKPNTQLSEQQSTVHIIKPFMLPYNQFALIRKINKISVLRSVRNKIKQLNFKNDLTVTSLPHTCDYVGCLNEKKLIYVCVDEYSKWTGVNSGLIQSMEKKLIEKSDLIFATSKNLQKNKFNQKTDTVLLTHGVDLNHFKLPYKKINPEKLQIYYFGLFDDRSDQSIIQYIANHVAHSEIHIIGDVNCDISELKNNRKIIFHGPVQYKNLPNQIVNADIFILPYKKNELTKFINPLKLKECLCTGRAVISTSLPEVLDLKEHLFIADSGEEFKKIIDQIATGHAVLDFQKTFEFISETESWADKAADFSKKISEHLF
jgi:Glycosyl transferases group 1